MKYRKKPVVIEAIQWTNNNLDEVLELFIELNANDEQLDFDIFRTKQILKRVKRKMF